MKIDTLDSNQITQYTSVDLIRDYRINVFRSSGPIAIFFIVYIIGYFISGEQFFFSGDDIGFFFLQFIITTIGFIIYVFFHDLIHYLSCKLFKIDATLKFKFGIPYIIYSTDIEKKWKYYLVLLSPSLLFLLIFFPFQIIISLFYNNWFWLPWSLLILNSVFFIDDLTYIIYSLKYKKSYLQISDKAINIYVNINEFSSLKKKEKEIYQSKLLKRETKKARIKQIKEAPKLGKSIYKNQEKPINDSSDDQDLNDLNKLDM